MMNAFNADKIRRMVFDHYGWFCACCGTSMNLSIDHVNGDGKRHREMIGKRSLWRWVVDNGFPDGYQVLCRQCNSSKNTEQRCKIHGDMFAYEIGKRASYYVHVENPREDRRTGDRRSWDRVLGEILTYRLQKAQQETRQPPAKPRTDINPQP